MSISAEQSFKESWAKLPEEKKKKIEEMKNKDKEEISLLSGIATPLKKLKGLTKKDKRKLIKKPESAYLVKMMFSNGTSKSWVVVSEDEFFVYKKRMYYLRKENSFYNLTHRQDELIYFDDYVCPVEKSPKLLEDSEEKDETLKKTFFSIVPSNIKPIIRMEYIKALAESSEFSKYLKLALVFALLNLIILIYIGYQIYRNWGLT